MNILVYAEDNAICRRATMPCLMMELPTHVELRVAEDGKQAIALMQSYSDSHQLYLITDYEMPYFNGLEVMKAGALLGLKRAILFSGTGADFPHTQAERLKAGFPEDIMFMTKPGSHDMFTRMLAFFDLNPSLV